MVSMPGSASAPCNADLRVQAARVTTVSRGARPVVQLSAGDAIEMAAARRLSVVPAGLLPECRPGERLDGPGGSDVLLAGVDPRCRGSRHRHGPAAAAPLAACKPAARPAGEDEQDSTTRQEATVARYRAVKTVDELLARARAMLPHRLSPAEALRAQASGALLIDIRGDDQRRDDGLIPGAIVLTRNCLEWRCDPASEWRHHPPGPAHHPGLRPGIPVQPCRGDPAATRPDPRHRPRWRIHRLGRSRPTRDHPGDSRPRPIR